MKAAVLVVFTVVYLYQMVLSVIHMRSARNPVPVNVIDVYDEETYGKWRAYHGERSRFAIVSGTASFLIDFALLAFNAYAAFAGLFPRTPFLQMFAVMLLSALSSLLMIPFSWHSTMGIEEKYGFNKATAKTFWGDQAKEFLIGLVLMTGIGALLMAVHQALGDWLILAFAILMTVFALIISFLYPVLSRVFNKFQPLCFIHKNIFTLVLNQTV